MITPSFRCEQSPNSLVVTVYCPAVRAADLELHVEDTLLSVHINPYFLRLNLPGAVTEDDDSSARYDPGTGHLTLTLTKCEPGKNFEGLDLLAKLLAPKQPPEIAGPPSIEVLSDEPTVMPMNDDDEEEEEDEVIAALDDRMNNLSLERQEILKAAENDWQLPQAIPEPFPIETSVNKRYGFLNLHTGYFTHAAHSENEVNELGADTETCTLAVRRSLRLKHEAEKWDEEHYIADFADDEYIRELIGWKNTQLEQNASFEFTEEENATMMRLPRREYLMSSADSHNLYLTLVSILFAYAYETRTTQADFTPESAWTICSLVPAFSALDPPPYSPPTPQPLISPQPTSSESSAATPPLFTTHEITQTLIPSYRRSLIFPLYRSFALAEQCRKDVVQLLNLGQRSITRCLLGLKYVLDHHEVYYVYSKVWVDDLCVWVQAHARDEILSALGSQLSQTTVPKSSLGLDLDELEAAVRETESDDSSDLSDDSTD